MMQFIVISHSETDGPLIEEFNTRSKAVNFADAVAREGMPSTILMKVSEVSAEEQEPEDFGVLPGIDFPATLYFDRPSTRIDKLPPTLCPPLR